jgi:predicted nucleic acid-binding protein
LPLFYADASALVKLVHDEAESRALRTFIADADLVSCELVLVEVPRAIRRLASYDPEVLLATAIARMEELFEPMALLPLGRPLLERAGALAEPLLRALDAVHVVSALELSPIDGFLSYDERQCAVARLAGLRTVQPSALP